MLLVPVIDLILFHGWDYGWPQHAVDISKLVKPAPTSFGVHSVLSLGRAGSAKGK
jgi:hypothetical protein